MSSDTIGNLYSDFVVDEVFYISRLGKVRSFTRNGRTSTARPDAACDDCPTPAPTPPPPTPAPPTPPPPTPPPPTPEPPTPPPPTPEPEFRYLFTAAIGSFPCGFNLGTIDVWGYPGTPTYFATGYTYYQSDGFYLNENGTESFPYYTDGLYAYTLTSFGTVWNQMGYCGPND